MHPHALLLLSRSRDYSFPSDHTMIAGAFAVGLWRLNRSLGMIAIILALLLAFARVYTGMYYPSDVITGLVIGGSIGAAVQWLGRAPARRLADATMCTPLRRLIAAS